MYELSTAPQQGQGLIFKITFTDPLKKIPVLNFDYSKLEQSLYFTIATSQSDAHFIMAPIEKKRKDAPTNESFARSRKSNGDDRLPKRPRPDEKEGKLAAAKLSHVPKISKL